MQLILNSNLLARLLLQVAYSERARCLVGDRVYGEDAVAIGDDLPHNIIIIMVKASKRLIKVFKEQKAVLSFGWWQSVCLRSRQK